jgi:hypothetical protein
MKTKELKIGNKIMLTDIGQREYKIDKELTIQNIYKNQQSHSKTMVLVSGYHKAIDSVWLKPFE